LQVSGTIRNCCFEAENELQNLLLVSEFLWPALLLPVAGNKVTCYTFSYLEAFLLHIEELISSHLTQFVFNYQQNEDKLFSIK